MFPTLVARRLLIRIRPLIKISKSKERLDFLLSLIHILMFYAFLLTSITWYEKYMSWAYQLSTWLLTWNCYFYTLLLYVNNAKKPFPTFNKKALKSTLSRFYTFTYIMNLSLTYYFLLVVYPKSKELDAQQLVIYMYPGLSVFINVMIDFSYTKSLHFQGLGFSAIMVSMYMALIAILRYTVDCPNLTETELRTAGWFDAINLKSKFLIFITVMTINYLALKFIFYMSSVLKSYKQKLRAQTLTPEIHQ